MSSALSLHFRLPHSYFLLCFVGYSYVAALRLNTEASLIPNVRLFFQSRQGLYENSPAIYRWEQGQHLIVVPKGRLKTLRSKLFNRPSRTLR